MRTITLKRFALLMLFIAPNLLFAQIGSVNVLTSPTPLSSSISSPTYTLIELGLTVPGLQSAINSNSLNPYDPDVVNIVGELWDVQNNSFVKNVYGFYMKEYDTDALGNATTIDPVQDFPWRMRFVVEEAKHYRLTIRYMIPGSDPATYPAVYDIYGQRSTKHGYLRLPAGRKYMQFTDGTPFFAIGETFNPYDIGKANKWEGYTHPAGNTSLYPTKTASGFSGIINQLSSVGGNFIKYYFSPTSLDIEWPVLGSYHDYQNRAHDLDKIVANMDQKGVFVQFGLWTHEQFNAKSSWPGYDWNSNPYRTIPYVTGPIDLFIAKGSGNCGSNSDGLKYLKRKARYFIARWGYSPSIATVEVMTELDNLTSLTEAYWSGDCKDIRGNWVASNAQLIDGAITEIANYIKSLSSRMMVTTGVKSHYGSGSNFFKSTAADYADYHAYQSNYVNGMNSHAYIGEELKSEYNKPFHCGETGSGADDVWYNTCGDLSGNVLDPETQFSNPMWSTCFSGSFGNAMPFDTYGSFHSIAWGSTGYRKFKPLSEFFKTEDLNSGNYESIKNKSQGGITLQCPPAYSPNQATPECLLGSSTIFPQTTLAGYTSSKDVINGLAPGSVAPVVTSDDDNIEVYALRNPKRVLGWVHNKSNYFYNLPHFGQAGAANTPYFFHPLPNGSLEPLAGGNQPQQHQYTTDLFGQTMTIKGFDCSVPYRIDWYATRGAGGVIPAFTQTGIMPNNGEITVTIPDLRAVSVSHNSLPDYGFKIYAESEDGYSSSAEWKSDYLNANAEPINDVTDIAFSNNNRIYYRGLDEKLHCYYWDYSCWEEKEVPVWGPNDDPASNDRTQFAITGDNKVFYRNRVNWIEQVYEIAPTNNTPNWIAYMHTNIPMASSTTATIKFAGNSIFYVSADDYITELYWNGSAWAYRQINWAPKVGSNLTVYNSFDVSGDRKVFYRNINGKIEQLWWDANTNSWIDYIHNTAPSAAPGTDIRITPDGKVAYQSVNNYLAILWFDQNTQTWVSQEISWIPKFNPGAGGGNINANIQGQIFYGNINDRIQEVYWGNYMGTYQWIGYEIGYQYRGNRMVISKDNKMFYHDLNGFSQIYFDANTSSWIQYLHPNVSASPFQAHIAIDRYNKVFYVDNSTSDWRLSVLFWDDPCRKYPPCTFTNYRRAPIVVDSQKVDERSFQIFSKNGLNDLATGAQYQVYPNPSSTGKFAVNGFMKSITIEVLSVYGQTLSTAQLTIEKNAIDLNALPNGVYILNCSGEGRTETHRIVLNR